MQANYKPAIDMTNGERKREAARQHNELIEKGGYGAITLKVIEPVDIPSQRNALAAKRDATSGHPNRTWGGRRMRNRAGAKLDAIMKGRNKINRLLARAGIYSNI